MKLFLYHHDYHVFISLSLWLSLTNTLSLALSVSFSLIFFLSLSHVASRSPSFSIPFPALSYFFCSSLFILQIMLHCFNLPSSDNPVGKRQPGLPWALIGQMKCWHTFYKKPNLDRYNIWFWRCRAIYQKKNPSAGSRCI